MLRSPPTPPESPESWLSRKSGTRRNCSVERYTSSQCVAGFCIVDFGVAELLRVTELFGWPAGCEAASTTVEHVLLTRTDHVPLPPSSAQPRLCARAATLSAAFGSDITAEKLPSFTPVT
eukprot:2442590-Prymnesium_polylepis.1